MHWEKVALAVGARIRRLRKTARLTIEELADKAGTDPAYLGAVERGSQNPTLRVLVSIAVALGVGLSTLIDADAEMTDRQIHQELRARFGKLTPQQLQIVLRLFDAIRL